MTLAIQAYRRIGTCFSRRSLSTASNGEVARAVTEATRVKQYSHPDIKSFQRQRQQTWSDLMRVFAKDGMIAESMALLDDMQACRASPSVSMLDLALEAAVVADHIPRIRQILSRYTFYPPTYRPNDGVFPFAILCSSCVASWTPTTYTHLLHHCARTTNVEYMLLLVCTAKDYKVKLEEDAFTFIVQCAKDAQEPRIAFEIVQEAHALHGVSARVWMHTLRVCATQHYAPGLELAWKHSRPIVPDDGLLVAIITAASRAGLSPLVSHALAWISEPTEAHLIPAFEAFCNAEHFDKAMNVLGWMHASGIELHAPLVASLSAKASSSARALDVAIQAVFQQSTWPPPTCAWNALVYAASERRQLPTAESLVHATPEPTSDTFQAWLDGCLAANDMASARNAWAMMQTRGIIPSAACFERMTRMHLVQPRYEEAFALLEEAKQRALVPTRRMYAAMIWTCWKRKDERWRALLHEMQEANYEPGHRLRMLEMT